MPLYEAIQNKIDLTITAANRTSGAMQAIWIKKAQALQAILDTLTIEEAQEVVNG